MKELNKKEVQYDGLAKVSGGESPQISPDVLDQMPKPQLGGLIYQIDETVNDDVTTPQNNSNNSGVQQNNVGGPNTIDGDVNIGQ